MIGAILTTAAFALLSSMMAAIGNFAISRDFPDYKVEQKLDTLLMSPSVSRFLQYRMMANIFYHQALVLWSLLGLLLACEALSGL